MRQERGAVGDHGHVVRGGRKRMRERMGRSLNDTLVLVDGILVVIILIVKDARRRGRSALGIPAVRRGTEFVD